MSAELLALLDGLDAAREKARSQRAWRDWPYGVWEVDSPVRVAQTAYPADATLIVAAVNRLPELTAALRAVLDRHHDDSTGYCHDDGFLWPCRTYRDIAAALTPEQADR